MNKNNLPGLSPLWLISLSLILGCVVVVMIPVSIATGDAIKSSDWIGFAGNVVAGVMTLIAATVAWFSVQGEIKEQKEAERLRREQQTTDLARILYAELAHLLARCCFDFDDPWRFLERGVDERGEVNVLRLRRFTPVDPVIYRATAGQLASLHGAAQHLMEFHYRLSALRRDIENIADAADSDIENIADGADIPINS